MARIPTRWWAYEAWLAKRAWDRCREHLVFEAIALVAAMIGGWFWLEGVLAALATGLLGLGLVYLYFLCTEPFRAHQA